MNNNHLTVTALSPGEDVNKKAETKTNPKPEKKMISFNNKTSKIPTKQQHQSPSPNRNKSPTKLIESHKNASAYKKVSIKPPKYNQISNTNSKNQKQNERIEVSNENESILHLNE